MKTPGFALLLLIAPEARAEQHAFFESKVRPVLVEHCYECHSVVNSKGGLLLDTRQGCGAAPRDDIRTGAAPRVKGRTNSPSSL